LLNNVPATSAQVLEDSELIDYLLARVRELRPDLDVENVAETLKYCLAIGYELHTVKNDRAAFRAYTGEAVSKASRNRLASFVLYSLGDSGAHTSRQEPLDSRRLLTHAMAVDYQAMFEGNVR
jgi:hypothetical protein